MILGVYLRTSTVGDGKAQPASKNLIDGQVVIVLAHAARFPFYSTWGRAAGRIPRLGSCEWLESGLGDACKWLKGTNSQSIVPFRSLSASRIISSISSSVRFSPSDFMTWRSSSAEMVPLPSLSKTLNAARVSWAKSVALTVWDIILRNSSKSMLPLWSTSTSLI